jgi:hypothetical protein
LEFQGTTRPGATVIEKVITLRYSKNGGPASSPITVTVNSNGEGPLTLEQGNYVFLIKTPGYLAKKYGTTANPISVTTTTNSLDLSSSPLKGGDFNGDGIVNEIDYSLNFLPNFLGTDPVVDVDGSGQVNNLDFTVMRSNWNLVDDTL